MAVNTTYDDKMFRFFDLRQVKSGMTQQFLDPVTGKIVTQEIPQLVQNAIVNEVNSEIRKYLDAHAKKLTNWTPSDLQKAKGVQRRYDVTNIEGLKNMAELRRGMQKLVTEIAFRHASELGTDTSGRQIYGLPQLQDVFPDFKTPLTAADLRSGTVGLGTSFKTVGGTRYDVTDMPSRNIGEAERLLKASGVQTIEKDTLAGKVSYAVPDDSVVRQPGKPDELALDVLQQVLSPTAVQSRYEAGVKSKTKELEDRQKATDRFTRKRINVTKGGLTRARINELVNAGMTRIQARAQVRTPEEQEQLYNDALEAVLGGKNYASAGQVRNLSPELKVVQNAIRGAQASEAKLGDAAPFLERKTIADLKAQALKEDTKEAEFMRQYQAFKDYGTPMSNAARRYFEQNADKDNGAALAAKTQALARRSFVVRKANVALAKDILSKKSQYGRKSPEVRWARDIMKRERDLKRGGGAFGRIFGGLPPALIPILAGVQLIAKLAGFINETLNKVYKIIDQTTGKARERQQEVDALQLSQARGQWAESMKNAFGYNFTGAYTQTAKGLSDIISGEGGTEQFITAMALQGSNTGIAKGINQALNAKDTVGTTHAALAAFISNTAAGLTTLGKTSSDQAYLANKQQLEKYVGADTATLAGQLYTQYKSMSASQKAQAEKLLSAGDVTGYVDMIANSTGAAGVVAMTAASTQMTDALSSMSKMLNDEKEQYQKSFEEIRNQTALTWGETTNNLKGFSNQLKLSWGHLVNGTFSSVSESSSDAEKYRRNKQLASEAAGFIKENESILTTLDSGVLSTLPASEIASFKKYALSGNKQDTEQAWGEIFRLTNAYNLNEQQQNELVAYMNAQANIRNANKVIKDVEEQNRKNKGIHLVANGALSTIQATSEMQLEQAGYDAVNYTFGEKAYDMLTGGLAGASAMLMLSLLTGGIGAIPMGLAGFVAGANMNYQQQKAKNNYITSVPQVQALNLDPNDPESYKSFARNLAVAGLTSSGVDYASALTEVLNAASAAGYSATVQEVKLNIQDGTLSIEFDDPNSGRRRTVDTPVRGWYSGVNSLTDDRGQSGAENALQVPSVQNK